MILHQDQPDYAAQAEDWEPPFMPTFIRDMWAEGDDEERRTVDRMLANMRAQGEREHHRMVFGAYPFI